MDGLIHYLNCDLDVRCGDDLTALAEAFQAGGVRALHVTDLHEGGWYATFETHEDYTEPEPNIAAFLDIIEAFDPSIRGTWDACHQRDFNIGYDCGNDPWQFNQAISADVLGRMAKAGASLRITIYPERTPANPCPIENP